jgi:recombination protein RecR
MAFSLLHRSKEELEKFAHDLLALGSTKTCATCGMLTDADTCVTCRDTQRERSTVCVVETPVDVIAIERAGAYRGLYHVLGGTISPLEHIGPEHLNISSLLRRVRAEQFAEVVLALNPSTEGETTALYLADQLGQTGATVTRIAQGLPTGAALEFADDLTIARAIAGRREVQRNPAEREPVRNASQK